MNVALYGGTFDPVHLGHVAVARAAAERFALRRIYFVPAEFNPHKQGQRLTDYYHRYAMLALALQGEKNFLPSLLEAPEIIQAEGESAAYSVETVRRFRRRLGKRDKLFFLVGIDAFLDISTWRDPVELLRECEFIVASRPGFSLGRGRHGASRRDAAAAGCRAVVQGPRGQRPAFALRRQHSFSGRSLGAGVVHRGAPGGAQRAQTGELVAPPVAEYIRKMRLYQNAVEPGSPELPSSPLRKLRQAGKGLRLVDAEAAAALD